MQYNGIHVFLCISTGVDDIRSAVQLEDLAVQFLMGSAKVLSLEG